MGGAASGQGLRLAAWLAAAPLGAACQLQQAALWPPGVNAAVLAAALVLLALAAGLAAAGRRAPWWLAGLSLLLLGFGLTAVRAHARLADTLAPALEGQDVVVIGVVDELPRERSDGTRFVFEVEQAWHQGRPVTLPRRLALGWYRGGFDDGLLDAPPVRLQAGERWQLTVRLRAPHGNLNPHGFDFELWLFERRLGATGYVRSVAGAVNRRLALRQGRPVERARQAVRDAIGQQVVDARAAGVLAALAIGDQAAIERSDWDLFRDTGVAHLMSISGLHVTMFAWLAGAIVGALWRRSGRALLLCPAPRAALWGGLAAATAYAMLAGWGVPAQRTVWMLATAVLLGSAGVRWPWPLVLGAAATVVALADPWALLQPGFWLSFVAVGLLLAAEPALRDAAPGEVAPTVAQRAAALLRGGLRTQAVATLGLAPLTLVFFHQVSLVGFVANLVTIPLVTLLVTPLALLGVLWAPLWQAGAWLVQGLSSALAWLAAAPVAVWTAAAAPPWAQALGLLGGALLVAPLPWRLRAWAPALLLPLLLPVPPRPAAGQFELLVADVGQGSAVLVRTRAHLLLYDTGPRYAHDTDAGERVLLPLLRARGERRVDGLVLSHGDADHVGGAAAVMARLPVHRLLSSLDPAHPLLGAGVPHQRCAAGQGWRWDGVDFDVLHPLAGDHRAGARPNALSCVLRVRDAAGRQLLLAGDIEAAQEAALLARDATALRSDWLLVPHHGSRTSSSAPFLAAVAPRVALVQAGYRNRFGHPAPDVLARYEALGIDVVRSDRCGAWHWRDGRASCERQRAARYWHHAGGRPDGVEVASTRPTPSTRSSWWPSMSR